MSAAMEQDLKYLCSERNRHGSMVFYVRVAGKRIRIREKRGTPAFLRAYADAVDRLGPRARQSSAKPQPHPPGSLGWLGTQYFKTKNDFLKLAKESRRARRNCLEECFREPFSAKDPEPMGNCPLSKLSAQNVAWMIDAKAGQPGAAANRRKHLSALCAWGVAAGHLPTNPARDVKAVAKIKGGGYYTWTTVDVEQFLEHHGKGTKARLALALLLFTGARRQDMVTFGKQHVRGGWIRYVPLKTLHKRRDVSQKPFLPVLADIIASSPCGSMTFLVTAHGKPFTPAGFGNWFRDRCNEAGLPQCTAHGLKKAGATLAAENGATTSQLMAMFDWSTVSQAEVYTRAADRKRLAGEGMGLINLDQNANETVAPSDTETVAPLISKQNQ